MTTVEPAILNWRDDDENDTSDLLHKHFEELECRDCIETYDEVLRLYNAMFVDDDDLKVERDSVIGGLLYAAVCAGQDVVYRKIGKVLNVSPVPIETFFEDWLEHSEKAAEYTGFDGLRKGLSETEQFHKDLKDGKYS